ncbi:MAG: flagellar basal body rod protein FlgB [Zoogloea oleivorans]|jgi:flagellar basal-body rod protein FlgB|uniref:Flagellar basal body rod protein FlgB n=1 Tax=Zoogloea oleivorans TaxID=1552750 RepID=A0A6C2CB71_9RHOO|nr:flagellar basal body rod protein FlgB [Zoogloea oleivorans]MBP8132897.1 flagellar basal body rod protein FlgB [Zoogloea sp.]MBT9497377.1 flagellar basal body rod protein FlgB [Zoogloea sp.]MDY0037256.1 flagellar basal body rod protein FlgB [Zoogloea oleivorans]TYC50593.1 flagellar basal body rod protein FlgB [Zoogloea oleivorans]
MTSRLDQAFNFHQVALNARAYRQQVIASNIANADTPNFKARDVDFREALSGALGGQTPALNLKTTAARHLSGSAGSALDASLKYRNEEQGSVDGNTVNMDVERSAFAENSVQYQASVTFINGLITGMQRAIQGQ